jgi:hypothetical protein
VEKETNMTNFEQIKIKEANLRDATEVFLQTFNQGGNNKKKLTTVPAANAELFGHITHELRGTDFIDRGHMPIKMKLCENKLYAFDQPTGSAPLEHQKNLHGHAPKAKAKLFMFAQLTVDEAKFQKTTEVDWLYRDIKKALPAAIEKPEVDVMNAFLEPLGIIIGDGSAFKVREWTTKNIETGQTCVWRWMNTNTVSGNEAKLVLSEVDNFKDTALLDEEFLKTAAGDMWEDVCETYIYAKLDCKTMCASEAEIKGFI